MEKGKVILIESPMNVLCVDCVENGYNTDNDWEHFDSSHTKKILSERDVFVFRVALAVAWPVSDVFCKGQKIRISLRG